ncbi:hypothetical protein H5410_014500 [Solanum commersonii]|uniref:Uncharacterized protein n=1 Tax=Solanum commersonii TaxID=4109 RepID=A0A9J5ZRL0_SOLCO|nr:hypothetical protein H5410_014500 [Solanum commersonii]
MRGKDYRARMVKPKEIRYFLIMVCSHRVRSSWARCSKIACKGLRARSLDGYGLLSIVVTMGDEIMARGGSLVCDD